jgi:prepilin-type N-terminal cleavage/methylation domain-containing protein
MTEALPASNSGFTLLEVIVAFTIAATALGLLFRIQASSTATALLSEEYHDATSLAQTLIAEHSVTGRLLSFTRTGSMGKYNWTVRAEPYPGAPAAGTEQRPPYRLRSIAAEVTWASRDRTRRVALGTVKPLFDEKP